LGITSITQIRTVHRTLGATPAYNDLIQTCRAVDTQLNDERRDFYLQLLAIPPQRPAHITVVPIRALDDAALMVLSQKSLLALDLAEMRTVQAYYQRIDRDPSDGELETIAQTWSEHCSHKTFKGLVHYSGVDHDIPADQHALHPALVALGTHAQIDSLIRTYLMRATTATAPHLRNLTLISAFVDNAGIVAFDDEYELSFKVETHNHPSALEPFGGANTGMGGVLRDVLRGISATHCCNRCLLFPGRIIAKSPTLAASPATAPSQCGCDCWCPRLWQQNRRTDCQWCRLFRPGLYCQSTGLLWYGRTCAPR
jgi:phosphoribosylformylglycinamidine synthase